MSPLSTLPPLNGKTFLDLPLCTTPAELQAHFAILGLPYGCSYPGQGTPNDQSHAPAAVRQESSRLSLGLDRWDFDLNGAISGWPDLRLVDGGDIPGEAARWQEHYQAAEDILRCIIACRAYPVVIGGDHGVTIPVLRAFSQYAPLILVQVDAHLDWRDEVNGEKQGYSSPIRRASEMQHIEHIFQIGLRAQGSARKEEVDAAVAYGSHLITSYEVHEAGMSAILKRIPDDANYYLTIDADGFDPSVIPAVEGPAAGGLTFLQVRCLIQGLVNKGHLVGMDIVEIAPGRDVNGISAITAGQLILNYIGAAAQAGYCR